MKARQEQLNEIVTKIRHRSHDLVTAQWTQQHGFVSPRSSRARSARRPPTRSSRGCGPSSPKVPGNPALLPVGAGRPHRRPARATQYQYTLQSASLDELLQWGAADAGQDERPSPSSATQHPNQQTAGSSST